VWIIPLYNCQDKNRISNTISPSDETQLVTENKITQHKCDKVQDKNKK
jgi:hypothetical protein